MENVKFVFDEDGKKCYITCDMCGCDMLYKNDLGYIASSDCVPGFPLCHSCLVEHCMETNCMKCPYGNGETCSFVETKNFYLEEQKREMEEAASAIDMHIYRYSNGRMTYECIKVLERENGYVPLHFSKFYEYKKSLVGVAYFENGDVIYFDFENNWDKIKQAVYQCYVDRVNELKKLIVVTEKETVDALLSLSCVMHSQYYLPDEKIYLAKGIQTYALGGKCIDTSENVFRVSVDDLFPGELLTKCLRNGRFCGNQNVIHTTFVDGYATNLALAGMVPYSDKSYVRLDYLNWNDFCDKHCVEVFLTRNENFK